MLDAMAASSGKKRRKREGGEGQTLLLDKKSFSFLRGVNGVIIVFVLCALWSVPELLWLWKRIISLPIYFLSALFLLQN